MKKGIREIASMCLEHGITHIILSPGSRCAPLTIAFTQNSKFTCYQVIDERSAAFFALGISLKIKAPVAIICTSGSAVLNYGPALSEAFYSDIPLLALTADRPSYKIGHQDGQAINQVDVFKNYVHHSLNLQADFNNEEDLKIAYGEVSKALTSLEKGPVHINFQFDEPLYQVAPISPDFSYSYTVQNYSKSIVLPSWEGKKIVIVAGQSEVKEALNKCLNKLKDYHQVVVLSEVISNVKATESIRNANEIIRYASEELKSNLAPDILITFGKGIVSKILKTWIQKLENVKHYHVDVQGREINTYQKLNQVFAVDEISFLEEFLLQVKPEVNSFKSEWEKASQEIKEGFSKTEISVEYSDVWAYKYVIGYLPAKIDLHVANSMSVRYVNFLEQFLPESISVWVNRGVSGIDGSSSTAVGFSQVAEQAVWLLTGDLAFQYDINAFWNNHVKRNFKVIVFNNSGGGIFRMIEGPQSSAGLLDHFETPIQSDAKGIALRSKMNYFRAENEWELKREFEQFKNAQGASILEIFTPPEENEFVYKNWIRNINNRS